jgi:hypothetical protein
MSQPSPSIRKDSRIGHYPILLLGGFALLALATHAMAMANHAAREQDIVELRLGQRILVDDGTCPAGQIKEVSGAKMTAGGVVRARKCVPRGGPKQKVDTSRKF